MRIISKAAPCTEHGEHGEHGGHGEHGEHGHPFFRLSTGYLPGKDQKNKPSQREDCPFMVHGERGEHGEHGAAIYFIQHFGSYDISN